eukprot:CAMPEP_0197658572 /NCGR_PEP_ID=MMETSP1338-20131121/45315_1 /TAXON_ID=43686 ORGANISM="Pelagodinium beii, Strain RCC1491" /NCGR_SAMPLE_ID=MMETSP1338 /ASSEMBLY_ACC=CAM_ASM_000754 /LENGTH=182 /DNA_ID=CAMNT_0043235181 /DNA_START=70 /DNA_END=618 /DNA_ORIENTATION=+
MARRNNALLSLCCLVASLLSLRWCSFGLLSASGVSSSNTFVTPSMSSRAAPRVIMHGVTKELSRAGDGVTFPLKGDKVTMQYSGSFGGTFGVFETTFDSSYDRGEPFVFSIGSGQVIQGWEEGVPQMSLGEAAYLFITSDYAYGATGVGDIPPDTDLKFFVELLKIERDGKFTYEATSKSSR